MGEKWEGHRERLRRRAELEGFDLLREEHLVELLLFHAVPRIDVSKQAKALVDRFDTLHNILAASREALMETPGVTRSMADWIQMTAELMHAYEQVDHLSPCRIWPIGILQTTFHPSGAMCTAPAAGCCTPILRAGCSCSRKSVSR